VDPQNPINRICIGDGLNANTSDRYPEVHPFKLNNMWIFFEFMNLASSIVGVYSFI